MNVGLAGNVGKSFAWQVAEEKFDLYVIEISSFQLDGMYDFRADIAILMNITPDHLDRYNYDFQNYIDSKFRIIQNQTKNDFFVVCADDDVTQNEIKKRNIAPAIIQFSLGEPSENSAGVDKGNDYSMLKGLAKEKVKAIVCLGKDNQKIHDAFKGIVKNIVDASSMDEAVKAAYYLARNGDTVLLSPACASFDLFENYEDRGTQFKHKVRNL